MGKYLVNLEVVSTLKGADAKSIRMADYQYLPDSSKVVNGPLTVDFGTVVKTAMRGLGLAEMAVMHGKEQYLLLYLSEQEDGIYRPTSGFMEAQQSAYPLQGQFVSRANSEDRRKP